MYFNKLFTKSYSQTDKAVIWSAIMRNQYSPSHVKKFVEFFKFTKTYTKRTAVIGLDTIKKTLYEAVLTISGRGSENIKVFDGYNDELKAKDWLTI